MTPTTPNNPDTTTNTSSTAANPPDRHSSADLATQGATHSVQATSPDNDLMTKIRSQRSERNNPNNNDPLTEIGPTDTATGTATTIPTCTTADPPTLDPPAVNATARATRSHISLLDQIATDPNHVNLPDDDPLAQFGLIHGNNTAFGTTRRIVTDMVANPLLLDPLVVNLASLATHGPTTLLDRIAAHWVRVPSAVGDLYVASTDQGIAYVRTSAAVHDDHNEFADLFHQRFARPLMATTSPPAGLLPALHTHRTAHLRFDLRSLSHFEREVLLAVLTIPRGQVRPHTWVAHQIGRPTAVRAVGSALGHNPVPVLIPCHRVIRADGTLGDHVLGPPTKRDLLDAEGTNLGEVYELALHDIHYVGNDTTGTVCYPTCPNARQTIDAHRHGFHSVAQAGAAGYRPCPHCRPVTDEVV